MLVDVFDRGSQTPLTASLYALGLALRTRQGRLYSVEDLMPVVTELGYNNVREIALQSPPEIVSVIAATKPSC